MNEVTKRNEITKQTETLFKSIKQAYSNKQT